MQRICAIFLVCGLVGCGDARPTPGSADSTALPQRPAPPEGAPEYFDIGVVHRPITTDEPLAQLWFDRGLAQMFGFNHKEAIACYDKAIAADPRCAMAMWGRAYALGPHYNNPYVTAEAQEAASISLAGARALLEQATPVERALIEALTLRAEHPAPEDRRPLDVAYAERMAELVREFPDDADVAAFYAEARMNLNPWKLWSPDGTAAPDTPHIRETLERALDRWPDHPALCHLYIHTMEASPQPELASEAADRLFGLVPGVGHLRHMPSHIYVWTGRYADVVRTNTAAVEQDEAFIAANGRGGFFTLYRAHNYHFLAYGAMWEGQRALALKTSRTLVAEIPPPMLEAMPDFLDIFTATPLHVMVRFGLWEDILAEPDPGDALPAARAVWRYARGVALASLGRTDEASAEVALFETARAAVPESRMLFQNSVASVLAVGDKVLRGELAYRLGQHDEAFALLREAVVLDEQLNYDEPWGWMEPARHALGALLVEQGRHAEAEEVYRANLARYPENGWALHGLAECLRELGREAEAAEVQTRFEQAWARADIEIPGSCFCRTGK